MTHRPLPRHFSLTSISAEKSGVRASARLTQSASSPYLGCSLGTNQELPGPDLASRTASEKEPRPELSS